MLPEDAGIFVTKHVLIVGAGPGGLAAAMLLASAGVKVTVLEKAPRVGGRTSTIEASGFRFDLGPTFFLYPRVLEEIFETAGLNLRREIELVRLDPQYRLVFGAGGELTASPNLERLAEAVARIAPDDATRVRQFFADNRRKFEEFRPCLQRPFLSWRDVFSPALARLVPTLKPWRSLDSELKRYFRDPRVRLSFTFQSKYLGMSPFQCPSLFSILSFLEYEYGVYHPIGGCGAVTEAMARAACSLGVEVRLAEPVERLLFEGRKAIGARTAAGEYFADAVVLNADFARAMSRLVPDRLRRRWTNRKLARKKYSCSTFMLYLGLDRRFDDVAHHTIYLADDYEENLRDIEQRRQLSANPSFYVQNASVTDSTLAPRGMSTLYVLVPVTHQHSNVDWTREAPRYRDLALDRLNKIGIRDIRRHIRFEQVVTPREWEDQYEIYRGATFNLAHNFRQMLHRRPRNRFEDLENVYLVGGGTHPGSGLPVIFESSRITSRLLLEDLDVDHRLDRVETRDFGPPSEPEQTELAAAACVMNGVG